MAELSDVEPREGVYRVAGTHVAAGLDRVCLPDPDVLARAAEDGRILVTHDLQTMPRHFAAFITTRQSAGLLLIPQHLPIASAVDDLLLIWSTIEAEEWKNLICISPSKV